MTIRIAKSNGQLNFVTDLDAVVVQILNALAKSLGQVQLFGDRPAFLTSILNHILPVLFSRNLKLPHRDLTLCSVLLSAVT